MRVLHEFCRAGELPAACRGSRAGTGESRGEQSAGGETDSERTLRAGRGVREVKLYLQESPCSQEKYS